MNNNLYSVLETGLMILLTVLAIHINSQVAISNFENGKIDDGGLAAVLENIRFSFDVPALAALILEEDKILEY